MPLSVAKDFSDVPGGRFLTDGPFSGEAFRERLLRPALNAPGDVTIDLRGTEGFGSSFLEEAFGGLVRLRHYSKEELHRRLHFLSDDPTLIDEIWEYVDTAVVDASEAKGR